MTKDKVYKHSIKNKSHMALISIKGGNTFIMKTKLKLH